MDELFDEPVFPEEEYPGQNEVKGRLKLDLYGEAVELMTALVKRFPKNERLLTDLASTYWMLPGSIHKMKAKEYIKEALVVAENARTYLIAAQIFIMTAEPKQGRQLLIKAEDYKDEPWSIMNNFLAGYAHSLLNNWEESRHYFELCTDGNPFWPNAWMNLGLSHYKLGNLNEALRAYDYCIVVDENFANAYRQLGTIYFETNRYKDALEMFEKVLFLEPNNEHAQQYIQRIKPLL